MIQSLWPILLWSLLLLLGYMIMLHLLSSLCAFCTWSICGDMMMIEIQYHVCALSSSGTVRCWGNGDKGTDTLFTVLPSEQMTQTKYTVSPIRPIGIRQHRYHWHCHYKWLHGKLRGHWSRIWLWIRYSHCCWRIPELWSLVCSLHRYKFDRVLGYVFWLYTMPRRFDEVFGHIPISLDLRFTIDLIRRSVTLE